MFVKFSCGCIGLPNKNAKKTMIFESCDIDMHQENPCLDIKDMTNKDYSYLDEEKCYELFDKISQLTRDGHDMRILRSLIH